MGRIPFHIHQAFGFPGVEQKLAFQIAADVDGARHRTNMDGDFSGKG